MGKRRDKRKRKRKKAERGKFGQKKDIAKWPIMTPEEYQDMLRDALKEAITEQGGSDE